MQEKQVIIAHSTDKKTEAQMGRRFAQGHKANKAVEGGGGPLARGLTTPEIPSKAHHVGHHGSSQVLPTEHLDPALQGDTLIFPIFNTPRLTRIPRVGHTPSRHQSYTSNTHRAS